MGFPDEVPGGVAQGARVGPEFGIGEPKGLPFVGLTPATCPGRVLCGGG